MISVIHFQNVLSAITPYRYVLLLFRNIVRFFYTTLIFHSLIVSSPPYWNWTKYISRMEKKKKKWKKVFQTYVGRCNWKTALKWFQFSILAWIKFWENLKWLCSILWGRREEQKPSFIENQCRGWYNFLLTLHFSHWRTCIDCRVPCCAVGSGQMNFPRYPQKPERNGHHMLMSKRVNDYTTKNICILHL